MVVCEASQGARAGCSFEANAGSGAKALRPRVQPGCQRHGRGELTTFLHQTNHPATTMTTTAIPAHTLAQLSAPRPSQAIHREECTQCFDNQDSPLGLDVCLACFNGGCPVGSVNQHSLLHAQKTGHAVVVNIRRVRKALPTTSRVSSDGSGDGGDRMWGSELTTER